MVYGLAACSSRSAPVIFLDNSFFFGGGGGEVFIFLLRFMNKNINITIPCLQPNDTNKKNKKPSFEYIITIN